MPDPSVQAVAAIVAAGFNAADAARWVREAAAMTPEGADPATWLPDPGAFAMTAVIDEAAVQDARADWYVNAPVEFKLLLDDLSGQAPEVGLGQMVFYDPTADLSFPGHRGRPGMVGGSLPRGRASIGATGEIEPGGESAPQLGGEIADADWIAQNVRIDGAGAAELAATLAACQVPRRYLDGLARITDETPSGYSVDQGGRFYNRKEMMLDVCGIYRHGAREIYISPSCRGSQATMIHEIAHHAEGHANRNKPTARMQDVLDYQRNAFPRTEELHRLGLREYSLTDGHELYADSFVVALKGSPAQQAEWRRVTGIDEWDAVFAEAELFDPGQPRVPAGSPSGGQFAPAGGNVASAVAPPKLSYHAFQRMRERTKYQSVKATLQRLTDMPTPAGDWWVAMTRQGQLDGYLVGTDGVVKTVLGAWGKPRGTEVLLAEMATSRPNVRRSVEWQLANLTPAIAARFCEIAGIDLLTPRQLRVDWQEFAGYELDDLEALLIARSEAEDVEPEAEFFDPNQPRVPAGQPGGGRWVGGLSFTPASERAWTGKQQEAAATLTKQETGAIGEAVAAHALRDYLGIEFTSLNEGLNNAPVDMAGDHLAVEVKTGLASNGPSAQHWRATIGQPGTEEAALIKRMTPEQKRAYNERKAQAILERKYALLDEMSRRAGDEVAAVTVGVILSGDGRRADVWAIPDFHLRIGWNRLDKDYGEYFVGTWEVRGG